MDREKDRGSASQRPGEPLKKVSKSSQGKSGAGSSSSSRATPVADPPPPHESKIPRPGRSGKAVDFRRLAPREVASLDPDKQIEYLVKLSEVEEAEKAKKISEEAGVAAAATTTKTSAATSATAPKAKPPKPLKSDEVFLTGIEDPSPPPPNNEDPFSVSNLPKLNGVFSKLVLNSRMNLENPEDGDTILHNPNGAVLFFKDSYWHLCTFFSFEHSCLKAKSLHGPWELEGRFAARGDRGGLHLPVFRALAGFHLWMAEDGVARRWNLQGQECGMPVEETEKKGAPGGRKTLQKHYCPEILVPELARVAELESARVVHFTAAGFVPPTVCPGASEFDDLGSSPVYVGHAVTRNRSGVSQNKNGRVAPYVRVGFPGAVDALTLTLGGFSDGLPSGPGDEKDKSAFRYFRFSQEKEGRFPCRVSLVCVRKDIPDLCEKMARESLHHEWPPAVSLEQSKKRRESRQLLEKKAMFEKASRSWKPAKTPPPAKTTREDTSREQVRAWLNPQKPATGTKNPQRSPPRDHSGKNETAQQPAPLEQAPPAFEILWAAPLDQHLSHTDTIRMQRKLFPKAVLDMGLREDGAARISPKNQQKRGPLEQGQLHCTLSDAGVLRIPANGGVCRVRVELPASIPANSVGRGAEHAGESGFVYLHDVTEMIEDRGKNENHAINGDRTDGPKEAVVDGPVRFLLALAEDIDPFSADELLRTGRDVSWRESAEEKNLLDVGTTSAASSSKPLSFGNTENKAREKSEKALFLQTALSTMETQLHRRAAQIEFRAEKKMAGLAAEQKPTSLQLYPLATTAPLLWDPTKLPGGCVLASSMDIAKMQQALFHGVADDDAAAQSLHSAWSGYVATTATNKVEQDSHSPEKGVMAEAFARFEHSQKQFREQKSAGEKTTRPMNQLPFLPMNVLHPDHSHRIWVSKSSDNPTDNDPHWLHFELPFGFEVAQIEVHSPVERKSFRLQHLNVRLCTRPGFAWGPCLDQLRALQAEAVRTVEGAMQGTGQQEEKNGGGDHDHDVDVGSQKPSMRNCGVRRQEEG